MPKARRAPALSVLYKEVQSAHPRRDKRSDGWVGDPRHRRLKSDHNPDPETGIVRATDTDKDGIDADRLVKVAIADDRTSFVIYKGFIYSRTHGMRKRLYGGNNKHYGHVHISIRRGRQYELDVSPWGYRSAVKPVSNPVTRPTANTRLIKRGDTGLHVRDIQNLLNAKQYVVKVDGIFGEKLENAVKQFQRDRKLGVDGVVGPNTLNALRS